MKTCNCGSFPKILIFLLGFVVLIAISNWLPLSFNWGNLAIKPASTITVIGQAKQDQANQIASFTASIDVIEIDKASATQKVTEIMNQMIEEIKQFGISESDIKTNRVSVYQEDEYYREAGRYESEKGDWRAETSLEIKLKTQDGEDLSDKSSRFLALLNQSGANHVYGPNFSLDDSTSTEIELLSQAIVNARDKASQMAAANQQKVKKIISVEEAGANRPQMAMDYALPRSAGGAELALPNLEAGSTTLEKTVTVTFELQ